MSSVTVQVIPGGVLTMRLVSRVSCNRSKTEPRPSHNGVGGIAIVSQTRSGGDCDRDVGPRVIRFGFRGWAEIYSGVAINWEKAGKKFQARRVENRVWKARRIPFVNTWAPDNVPVENSG